LGDAEGLGGFVGELGGLGGTSVVSCYCFVDWEFMFGGILWGLVGLLVFWGGGGVAVGGMVCSGLQKGDNQRPVGRRCEKKEETREFTGKTGGSSD